MASGISNRPMGSGSVTNLFTGGMDLSQFGRPSLDASNYKSQESKDAWNNYMAAQGVRESLTPGSMGYGTIRQLPGESWNDWQSRSSAASDMFGGGLTGSGNLATALRREQGLLSGGSSSRSSGGGISYGGGGGAGVPQGPSDFYMGPFPTLVKQDIPWQEAGKRVQEANAPFMAEYERATPGQEATLRSLSFGGADLAGGNIPLSVLQASQRANAQAGYRSGLGVGGRAGGIQMRAGARDILSTSLDLMKQSAQIAASIPSILNAANQAKYQIAPANVFDAFTSQVSQNAQLANQQLISDWMNQPKPGQFDITTGSFVGLQPGSRTTRRYNPFA